MQVVRFFRVKAEGGCVDDVQLGRVVQAAYERGYAQGRADAAHEVGCACAVLPGTSPLVERLLVAAARGAGAAP